jgi:hypothetical protein
VRLGRTKPDGTETVRKQILITGPFIIIGNAEWRAVAWQSTIVSVTANKLRLHLKSTKARCVSSSTADALVLPE